MNVDRMCFLYLIWVQSNECKEFRCGFVALVAVALNGCVLLLCDGVSV